MNIKTSHLSTVLFGFMLLSNLLFTQCSSGQVRNANANEPLKLTASISLPNVSGRIDHLAFDSKRHFIYVAALSNNTVEVVDLKNKKVVHTIKGLAEPQGIRFIPESNTIFVANGDNGACDVFNADSYQQTSSIKLDGDADNVRYDSVAKRVYVGYGNGVVAIIDATTFKQLADIKLSGHPESFQLDDKRIFVNVPDAHLIEIINLEKNLIDAKWNIEEATANFPMALDATHHRLFIGCRHPAKLLVINSETGKTIGSFDTDSDADDIFYDSASKYIYMSCGGGYIDVFKQIDSDKYEAMSKIETCSGARTSLFVPELDQLFVAAPARSGKEAQLMIFEKKYPGKDTIINFENNEVGKLPNGFTQTATGKPQQLNWKVVNDNGNKFIAQLAKNEGNYYNLLVLDKPLYQNFKITVKIKAIAGDEDQGGGLVWRYIDNNNYYIARCNPLENNFRFYHVINGSRIELKSTDCAIKTGEWFTMSIEMNGNKISCSLNGNKMIDATDDTFKLAGHIGLWTKADAQSYFDDLVIHPFK